MSEVTQVEPDYSSTVLLPKTEFPQRAELSKREPEILARWERENLAAQIEANRAGAPDFVLHDGPPYANGNIHVGHALNKSLKDFVVRYKAMAGFRARYVPGWDCHGLPIEQKVVEELRKKKTYEGKTPLEIRTLCAEYAHHWKAIQCAQFIRLGVGGDWAGAYMTLMPRVEVFILGALKTLNDRGYVYRGLKTVFWDTVFETALAEAEIEYNESHTSPSVWVKFPVLGTPARASLAGANVVIWTTTPWTLPANLGVSAHPEYDYVVYEHDGERLVLAKGLLEEFVSKTQRTGGTVTDEFRGTELEHLRMAHPLLEKESVMMLGEHVTLDQGTGLVHTAPAHGTEDLEVGLRYNLPMFNPVDERGRYNSLFSEMQGVHVFEANPRIVEKLKTTGRLVHEAKLVHSYPYSDRSRKPVIMRATEQWFLNVDHNGMREKALAAARNIRWVPEYGFDRISGMLEGRPDWCLSRQRAWGTPIPSLRDKVEHRSILDSRVIEKLIGYVAEEGTDAWFRRPVEDFLPDDMKAAGGAERYEKEFNILDVWFDAGCTHLAILNEANKLPWPADLYLEGSDQHRGWFQASMLVSMGTKDAPPFREVLTHGFVLDEKGEAMSKSLGNVINPNDIIAKSGADILRLWVASEDYRRDVSIGARALDQVSNTYRRFRNTIRFALGNLHDFVPGRDSLPLSELLDEDRWLLDRLASLTASLKSAYDNYEFHRVYHEVNNFCITELGALFLDMSKDRLYCSSPNDTVRRAAQTVLFEAASVLVRAMAPILPFTCEEAWTHLPQWQGKATSVHLTDFPTAPAEWASPDRATRWAKVLAVRGEVTRKLEALRTAKTVGNSLDARVTLRGSCEQLDSLGLDVEALRRVFIVSQVALVEGVAGAVSPEQKEAGVQIDVSADRAEGAKCARCWQYHTDLGSDASHPQLCRRCTTVVLRIRP